MSASSEYLARHNRALMVIAAVWAKEQNQLDQNVKEFQEKWKRVHVLENSQAKLDFEFNLRKTTTSRKPNENYMDVWYGIPAAEKFKKEEIGT